MYPNRSHKYCPPKAELLLPSFLRLDNNFTRSASTKACAVWLHIRACVEYNNYAMKKKKTHFDSQYDIN